jgi:hypothetical protein
MSACLVVEVADASRAIAYAVLIVAVIAAGVGECLHTTALTPLVAELALAHLRGAVYGGGRAVLLDRAGGRADRRNGAAQPVAGRGVRGGGGGGTGGGGLDAAAGAQAA